MMYLHTRTQIYKRTYPYSPICAHARTHTRMLMQTYTYQHVKNAPIPITKSIAPGINHHTPVDKLGFSNGDFSSEGGLAQTMMEVGA